MHSELLCVNNTTKRLSPNIGNKSDLHRSFD